MTDAMEIVLLFLTKVLGKQRYAKIIVCLTLMAFGIKSSEINKKLGLSYTTLRKYKAALETGEIGSLLEFNGARTKSELDNYEDVILKEFDTNPPKTLRDAQERIMRITGLKRSLHRTDVWLKKKGLKSRAVGFLPSKANPEEQREFLNNKLMPLIELAKNGAIELFFMDAAHFVMGGFAGRVWSVVRKYVKTACGRQRYNVLGALNFVSKKIETIVNDTYITSTQVIELLVKLTYIYTKPIKIILDNARYQRCKVVTEKAAELGIELVFLPTYSPNLNLIERVWKIVKSKVLNSAYYETFVNFCANIFDCIDNLHTEYSADMASSVSENFQIIDQSQIVT